MDNRVQAARKFINDNYMHRVSLVEVSSQVNLSPSRLRHLFKEETGLTPTKYIKKLRIEKARELLETTFLSVKEVSFKTGIPNECYFVREFKKAFGMPPLEYRQAFTVDIESQIATLSNE